jgi:hypothetical protein
MHDSTIKEYAISLRRSGKSYSEILQEVKVAKSTLSDWLRSVGLSEPQKQRLTDKRLAAIMRGGARKKEMRISRQNSIIEKAKSETKKLSKRDLLLIGTALYWAEGTKERELRTGIPIQFNNSDWKMVKLFCNFLRIIQGVNDNEITYELYLHRTRAKDIEKIRNFWCNRLNISLDNLKRVYFKEGKIKTVRHNSGDDYVGLVRVKVKRSSSLLRQIAGWTKGICEYNWEIV